VNEGEILERQHGYHAASAASLTVSSQSGRSTNRRMIERGLGSGSEHAAARRAPAARASAAGLSRGSGLHLVK
jgi:hypothetical protein